MLRWILALLALMVAVPAAAQADIGAARTAIEVGMKDSAAGWNAGDIDRFLVIYSDDPATSFTGSKGIARGKAGIRTRYMVSYAGQFGEKRDATAMSTLTFTFDDFRMLGPDHALLIARWTLTTPGQVAQSGMTSLVFRREKSGWYIVADHSS